MGGSAHLRIGWSGAAIRPHPSRGRWAQVPVGSGAANADPGPEVDTRQGPAVNGAARHRRCRAGRRPRGAAERMHRRAGVL